MLPLLHSQIPSRAEVQSFECFAIEIRTVASALAYSARLSVDDHPESDFFDAAQASHEFVSLTAAATQNLHRGDDLLTLVERLTGVESAGPGSGVARSPRGTGLHLLCVIAKAELLQREAARYRHDTRLSELAESSMARLADGYVIRFGSRLPDGIIRAFPGFAHAVRREPPWAIRPRAKAPSSVLSVLFHRLQADM